MDSVAKYSAREKTHAMPLAGGKTELYMDMRKESLTEQVTKVCSKMMF